LAPEAWWWSPENNLPHRLFLRRQRNRRQSWPYAKEEEEEEEKEEEENNKTREKGLRGVVLFARPIARSVERTAPAIAESREQQSPLHRRFLRIHSAPD